MRRGFTLIELMVVILLIALLATVVIVTIGERSDWAKWRLTLAQVKQLKAEVELFKIDQNRYPQDLEELVDRGYRDEMPLDGWGKKLIYRVPGARGAAFDVLSWASDFQPGGVGHAEDIWSHPAKR